MAWMGICLKLEFINGRASPRSTNVFILFGFFVSTQISNENSYSLWLGFASAYDEIKATRCKTKTNHWRKQNLNYPCVVYDKCHLSLKWFWKSHRCLKNLLKISKTQTIQLNETKHGQHTIGRSCVLTRCTPYSAEHTRSWHLIISQMRECICFVSLLWLLLLHTLMFNLGVESFNFL